MMKKLVLFALLGGFLAGILTLVPCVQAQVPETWTGSVSFTLKVSSLKEDPSGNTKFQSFNRSFDGTMTVQVGGDGLVQVDGCYLVLAGLIDDADATKICINKIVGIATDSTKSKNEKLLIVGIGDFTTKIEGQDVAGIVYLDASGTLKEDTSENPISAGLTAKIGGGFGLDFTFSGNIRTTLSK
jgi:hypothetical protein